MKHRLTSGKADLPDVTLVRPSDWNDFHVHEVVSPAQITANQDDFNPSASASLWRLSADAIRNITGIAGGVDGRSIVIINIGSFGIGLLNQNAGSAAANRIITGTGTGVTLVTDDTAMLVYDNTTQRWRIINTH